MVSDGGDGFGVVVVAVDVAVPPLVVVAAVVVCGGFELCRQ